MKCKILHENKGRMRVHICTPRMTMRDADILACYLERTEGVVYSKVYERTGNAVITYNGDRKDIIRALSKFRFDDENIINLLPENSGRELNREYQCKMVSGVTAYFARKMFLPVSVRIAYTVYQSLGFIWRGINCLAKGRLQVEVLDALSIGISVLRRDFDTASSVIFLLKVSETLEEWTHKKSLGDLARSLSLRVDKVWLVTEENDVLTPVNDIEVGSLIRVRKAGLIPLDGKVHSGEAMVNQASLTGESVPVMKRTDSTVYAGTVVEDGELVIEVTAVNGSGRYDRVVAMLEQSEKFQSQTSSNAAHLADKLVPYSLAGTAITYALTRNVTKALAILMVDFSCALKLAMPLSFLSAMAELNRYKITAKGGKYLEAVAMADTIVFDKTGTLTKACPTVQCVVPFNNKNADEMLRLAACLEEHYPHSMANAVVKAANDKKLQHEEMHSTVEYIVAHGIASSVDDKRVVVGSYHFVFEDEKTVIPQDELEKFQNLPRHCSHLFMACDGVLVAVICVSDPLREETPDVLNKLRNQGFSSLVMMTGDSKKVAAVAAQQAGVDHYRCEVLPDQKAEFVNEERADGKVVVMVGDGINDAPALSAADVGIAISDGAAIAREVADITVSADDLYALCTLKQVSDLLMKRVEYNYRFIMGFNGGLIALGTLGLLTPAMSALLHNLSTLFISLKSMTKLLNEDDSNRQNY